ncbi:MAG: peptidylprolyl isomerase [Propionibacteriaceae bacterium]|nr:peptidylprolyl isomerase [Propionibacteriaceae bacterium]
MTKRLTRLNLLAAAAALLLAGCAQGPATPASTGTAADASPDVIDGVATCAYNVSGKAARPVDPPPTANVPATGTVSVTLQLGQGPVTMTLDRERTPCTVNSFMSLLNQGFYTDTACHRLTTSGIFVLQCGDPTGTGTGGPGYSYADETYSDDTYPAGTVAMANAGPNTNGSQFFLVYQDSSLPPSYTVFGHLDAASLKVIADIAAAGESTGQGDGKPNQAVEILGYSMG